MQCLHLFVFFVMQSLHLFRIILQCNVFIFSRPTNFLQKSSCRVSSEKNILNSSVELSGVSGVEWKNWIKFISLFTFPHIFCFSLLSILSYEARMVHTCIIRKYHHSMNHSFVSVGRRLAA